MVKKILSFLVIVIMCLSTSFCKAADIYQKIDVDQMQYPTYLDFYPRTLVVNQGDILHLTIKAPRESDIRLFIPGFNLSREIAKNDEASFDLCIANPSSKVMWFTISGTDSKKVTGYIVVDNFTLPKLNLEAKTIDTSALSNIINYSTAYTYDKKSEPVYHETGAAAPVRGYW